MSHFIHNMVSKCYKKHQSHKVTLALVWIYNFKTKVLIFFIFVTQGVFNILFRVNDTCSTILNMGSKKLIWQFTVDKHNFFNLKNITLAHGHVHGSTMIRHLLSLVTIGNSVFNFFSGDLWKILTWKIWTLKISQTSNYKIRDSHKTSCKLNPF